MCLENGGGDDCGSVFRPLLALSDGGGFAHLSGSLHAERGGNLNVNELVSVLGNQFWRFSRPFSRRFRGQWQGGPQGLRHLAQRPVRRANVRNFVSQSVVSRERVRVRTGMSSRVCLPCQGRLRTRFRRASCFCTDYRGRTRVCITAFLAACWNAALCTIGVLGGWELERTGGAGPTGTVKSNPVSAVGADVVTQVSGVALLTRERARARCEVTVEPSLVKSLGVFTSFSPDGLELGQGRPVIQESQQ